MTLGSHIASLGLTLLICEYQERIRLDDLLKILWLLILVVRLRNGLLIVARERALTLKSGYGFESKLCHSLAVILTSVSFPVKWGCLLCGLQRALVTNEC